MSRDLTKSHELGRYSDHFTSLSSHKPIPAVDLSVIMVLKLFSRLGSSSLKGLATERDESRTTTPNA
jgi:hypothetical protein